MGNNSCSSGQAPSYGVSGRNKDWRVDRTRSKVNRSNKFSPYKAEAEPRGKTRRFLKLSTSFHRGERSAEIWFKPSPSGFGKKWFKSRWVDYNSGNTLLPDFGQHVASLFRILSAVDGKHDARAAERMKDFLVSDAFEPEVDLRRYTSRAKVSLNETYWTIMHSIPRYISRWDRRTLKDLRQFYKDIAVTHPCKKCRRHYSAWLRRYPVPNTQAEIVEWVGMLHNDINRRTGKPQFDLRRIDARWGAGPIPADGADMFPDDRSHTAMNESSSSSQISYDINGRANFFRTSSPEPLTEYYSRKYGGMATKQKNATASTRYRTPDTDRTIPLRGGYSDFEYAKHEQFAG